MCRSVDAGNPPVKTAHGFGRLGRRPRHRRECHVRHRAHQRHPRRRQRAGVGPQRPPYRKALLGEDPDSSPINRAYRINGVTFLMADSSIPGQDPGLLDGGTLAWLDRELAGRPLLVAPGVASTLKLPFEPGPVPDRDFPPAIAFHILADGLLTTHFRLVA